MESIETPLRFKDTLVARGNERVCSTSRKMSFFRELLACTVLVAGVLGWFEAACMHTPIQELQGACRRSDGAYKDGRVLGCIFYPAHDQDASSNTATRTA